MLRQINFTIYEKPIPQKRHRHTRVNHTCVYDPCKKDKLYYGILIKRAIEQHHSLKEHLLCGPISIDMKFYFALPTSKQAQKNKGLYHTNHTDLDNLIKFMWDCMNGILYADDAYIFQVNAIKCYTTEKTRTEVMIKEVLQEPILENNNGIDKKTQVLKQTHQFEKNIWPAKIPNDPNY